MSDKPACFYSLIIKVLLSLLLLNCEVFSQNDIKPNLDSLFNTFVSSRQRTRNEAQGINSVLSSSAVKPEKCSFGLSALVHLYFNDFSEEQKQVIKKITERPDLPNSIVSPSGHFRIHYNPSGFEKPQYDPSLSVEENVRQVALAFDSSYAFEVGFMGFPAPPGDGTLGGDNLYDVYIRNESGYGGTEPENNFSDLRWTSFITIDNAYSRTSYSTSSFDAVRVTAAHEFNHAIQIGCYALRDESRFFNEMTSTAMEDFVFDDINDYYSYIKYYFSNPERDYFTSANDPYNNNGYKIGFFDIFLKERYGFETVKEIIKKQWELYTEYPALRAINLSLLERNSSFINELDQFGIWTYFTGYRAIPGMYFKDAVHYPVISYLKEIDFSPSLFPLSFSTEPMSNTFLAMKVKTGSRTDTVVVKITNGDLNSGLNNPFSYLGISYDLTEGQKGDYKKVVNNYFSKLTSPNNNLLIETDFFNNVVADSGVTNYSELDYVYPNPYSYNAYHSVPVTLPVVYNDLRQAEIRIYSIGMNLVYSGKGEILDEKLIRSYCTKWNGLDSNGNKLPTGVYIYVTSSMGEIKKGKIVIKN